MNRRAWDSPQNSTNPERLIAAADAILVAEKSGSDGTVLVWRDDSRPARNGFSSVELVDAMIFLRRLGFIRTDGSVVGR